MSTPAMMEYMSHQFPTMFKSSSEGAPAQDGGPGGQKVVCTPEVSLYQYTSPEIGPNGATRLDDKGGSSNPELGLPSRLSSDPGSGGSAAGSTSSTGGFQCGFCGKTFQQKNTFQNHLRSHREGEDPYQCDICGKTFAVPARLTRHYRTHTGEKPYQCEYCNKSFSVKENLSVHRRIHTKERPYKCEVCERAFEHSGKLHRHMRIHTGERPHRCQICQKTFIQSGQLVIHMRTHTGEKPYVCKVCNKGFTCSKQLKVHTRTHTGEKPYTCDICGKSFGYNHVLKLHQVAHYGEKVYKCTLCNGTFTSKKSLETHIKTHSEGSVPNEPTSQVNMNMIEPSVMSPSSLSQTPPNSDKENRESSSDSEISSHNSPRVEPPKTPPSPVIYSSNTNVGPSRQQFPLPQQQFKLGGGAGSYHPRSVPGNMNPNGFANRDSSSSSNNSVNKNGTTALPYPMLPPGKSVAEHPPKTIIVNLHSDLSIPPVLPSASGTSPSKGCVNGRSVSPPPRHFSQIHTSLPTNKQNNYFSSATGVGKVFGGLLSNGAGVGTGKMMNENSVQSDKRFMDSASLRDKKVLPFLEQFGYGLPKELSASSQTNGSSSLSRKFDFERMNYERESRLSKEQVSILPISDSVSGLASTSPSSRLNGQMRQQDNYAHRSPSYDRTSRYSSDSRDRSPEILEYNASSNYTPGGVLALALTKGSKAVFQNGQMNSSLRPMIMSNYSRSNPGSPEIGLDFSSRRSISPTRMNNNGSPTELSPNSTPRSTPGLSESAEEFSDDHSSTSKGTDHEMNNNTINPSGSKRSRSSSSGGGPRKRSSLILEKYAQENPAAPSTPVSNESILSQRLRQSSVIQYAEKCS